MNPEPPDRTGEPELGWSAREIQEEFPDLHLLSVEIPAASRRSNPATLEHQLRELSNRWSGTQAINLRRQPVPAAYRVFYRHIGLDPDVTRTPIEAAIFDRLMNGGFLPSGGLADILLLALVETGVPVWALDRDSLDGPLGIRLSRAGEPLGRFPDAPVLPADRLLVADASVGLAVLFGEIAPGHQAKDVARRLTLFTVQVAGVSSMHVEEALWMCASALK